MIDHQRPTASSIRPSVVRPPTVAHPAPLRVATLPANREGSSIDGEGDDVVAALVVDLDVSAGRDHDVLLAVDRVGGRRRVDAGAGPEFPQDRASAGDISLEMV